MTPRIVACETVSLEGIIYTPGQTIDAEAWQRLTTRQRNLLLNTGKVGRREMEAQMPLERIVAPRGLMWDGIIHGPGWVIPPEVWLQIPEEQREGMLRNGIVERHET